MKLRQQPRNCGNCNYMDVKKYGSPVCYQIKQVDGKPVAVSVKRNGKACQSFREKVSA